jgi:hypothetical protein
MAAAPKVGSSVKRIFLASAACAMISAIQATPAFATTYFLTVAGLGGEADYETRFNLLANDTDKILRGSGGTERVIETLKGPDATRAKLMASLTKIAADAKAQDVLVLMMIGHGTFDGAEYKFNLPGPDISGTELAAALNKISASRQLIVDMTSASGGATAALKHEGRTVITATKSGSEKNATIFGRYWVEALRDPAADTDKNEIVSALEAFRYAQTKTAAFFTEQKRLATEHAQLANEDQQRAAAFPLVRYGNAAVVVTDPAKRALVSKKEEIENKIDALKYQKDLMAPEDYKRQIAAFLLELARTQEALEK